MKFTLALLALPAMAAAFAPSPAFSRSATVISMAPAGGKPAKSHDDDVDKTYKVRPHGHQIPCINGARAIVARQC